MIDLTTDLKAEEGGTAGAAALTENAPHVDEGGARDTCVVDRIGAAPRALERQRAPL